MEPYWSETVNGHAPHSVKYESEAAVSSFPYCTESSLNFSASATTYSEDDAEYSTGRRGKTSRQDPLSHRIIEKRRRDRMNSCLADLSRLIPPQYQRKGRGRIEKTEIIEMAIRHLKHLQSECLQKESDYRMGYTDCMKEAAKFLYDSQMQDFCYRLLTRLQEHCDEVMKNDCLKSRNCHALSDNVSASSGSPPQAYHQPVAPLCQLRDMLVASDMEQSNDHSDIKDLSFRNHLNQLQRNVLNGGVCNANESSSNSNNSISNTNNNSNANNNNAVSNTISGIATSNNAASSTTSSTSPLSNSSNKSDNSKTNRNGNSSSNNNNNNSLSQQPNQAPVITSTAPASLHHHTDSSNHDFDSSREPLLQTDASNMHSPPPRDSTLHHHHHHHNHQLQQGHSTESMLLQSSRLRNFSESSHDVEHNSNNYKYKNHIKERFNHELHDEETTSERYVAPPLLQSEHSHTHSMSEHSKDGTEPDVAPIIAKKRKLAEATGHASGLPLDDTDSHLMPPIRTAASSTMLLGGGGGVCDEKPTFCFSDIKTEPRCGPHKLHFASLQHSNGVTTANTTSSHRSFAVPIFALHGQGTYYVPLNVDYSVLMPFLNGLDLLEKNYTSMPVVHPVNINVNFMPPTPSASLLVAAAAAAAVAAGKQQAPPPMNCSVSSAAAAAVAAATKAKLEAITNGW